MTLASAAQPLALELHDALRSLDPARWRSESAAHVRRRLRSLRQRFAPLANEQAGPDEAPVQQSVRAVAEELGRPVPEGADVQKWIAFRARVSPAYESLVTALKAHRLKVPSLRPTNYTRSLFHVLNGLVVLAAIQLIPADYLVYPALGAFALVWTLEGTRRISPRWNDRIMSLFGPVAHPYEQHTVNSGTWYMTALMVLALMKAPAVASVAVVVLAFADPAAALVGRRFGSVPLINGRSLQGTLAFFVVGLTVAALTLVLFRSGVSVSRGLVVAGAAAFAGGLAELFSARVDDNLSIPLAAAAAAQLAMLVG